MWKKLSKTIIGTLFAFALLSSMGGNVVADGMIIPNPGPYPESMNYPEIQYHIVNVEINNQYVVTHINQEFYNPYNETLVGNYVFPIPEGAVISNFVVTVDGHEQTAELMDADEAKELFQQAVINMEDASLLQYFDNNIFSCEVAISPNGSIQMEIEYEEILTMNNGMYKYLYALSTERYSSSNIDNVSITVHINSDKHIDAVYCPSHTITTDQISSKEVYVYYSVSNVRPDTDFELYYSVTNQDFGASLLTFNEEDESFFMLFFNSNGEQSENNETIPKDIIFVIDESGSMSGEKINQAKNALKWILKKLGKDDRYNIINFDYNASVFSDELVNVNSETIQSALSYVDAINAGGGTNINEALLLACEILNQANDSTSPKIIFFLTDGLATVGVTNTEQIVENVRVANIEKEVDASIFVFGVGYNVNTHLLDKLSNENHGGRIYVNPGESIETPLIEIFSKIQNPLLTNISITFEGIETYETFPSYIPNLYEGSEIVLVGKYHKESNDNISVYVHALKGEETVELVFDFSLISDSSNSFVPRIWATRKIGFLMDKIKLEGETNESIEEIKALGMKYGIVTPYTSTIVHEQDGGITAEMGRNFYDYDKDGILDAWQTSGNHSNAQSKINYAYQGVFNVYETSGANIQTNGNKLFVNVNGTQIDLDLLRNVTNIDLRNGTVKDWVTENLNVTNFITFGSEEYFEFLDDKEFIDALSAGTTVVFQQGDEQYYVLHDDLPVSGDVDSIEEIEGPTPGFELILVACALALVLLWKRKRKS